MKNKIVCALMGAFLIFQSSLSVFAAGTDRIVVPDGYINSSSKIMVETNDDTSKELVSIRVKLDHGAYKDITDTKSFTVDENCIAYVKVKYKDTEGKSEVVELEKEIRNFDGVAPKVNAYIKGEDLSIQVSDDISGAKILNVDGTDYSELESGAIGIHLKDLESSKESFTVYAVDNAGNKTKTLRINNPYYVGDDPQSNVDRGVDNPQSTDRTKPTSATGLITSHTDEDGEDMASVSYREWKDSSDSNSKATGSKQFFTVKTKSDKTFYIVVDESYNQQTAYLLTEASENDLLNFVNYDGNSVDTGETTVYTVSKNDKKEVVSETNEVVEQDKETKPKNKSSIGAIVLAALAGVGIYFYKFRKNDDEGDEEDEYIDDFENTDKNM